MEGKARTRKGWYVDIVPYDERKDGPKESKGPYESEHRADKAERGININLDHERFYTNVRRV